MSLNIYPLQISGSLIIVTNPSGAIVYIDNIIKTVIIDGTPMPDTTPIIIDGLSEDFHTYRLTLLGYKDIDGVFEISGTMPSHYISEAFEQRISLGLQMNVLLPALAIIVGSVISYLIIMKYTKKGSSDIG